jgi:hypothetical protein
MSRRKNRMHLSSIAQEIEGHFDDCIEFDPPTIEQARIRSEAFRQNVGLHRSSAGSRAWTLLSRCEASAGFAAGRGRGFVRAIRWNFLVG